MKILEDRTAPNSRRVRMFLAEKEIDIPFEQVNSSDSGNVVSEFSEIRTFQSVPSLVLESGARISEVSAICSYFEALEPEPALFGEDPFGKGRVEMWNRRIEEYLFDYVFRRTADEIPGWMELNRDKANEAFGVLQSELEHNEFIGGKSFSFADIGAFVALETLAQSGIKPDTNMKALWSWYEAIKLRASNVRPAGENKLKSA